MRYAIRSLLKARAFTFVAIVTIALGVGSTTAVFSVVDAVLLAPLPFAASQDLVVVSGSNTKRGIGDAAFSVPAFTEIAARARSFSSVAAVAYDRVTSTGASPAEQLPAARVSASFFDTLGIQAVVGRTFARADDEPGNGTVVLGRAFWMRRFSGDAAAVGATLTLNGAPYTVIGALGIDLPAPYNGIDVWATRPEEANNFTPAQVAGGLGFLNAVARLAPGIGIVQAQAELDTIAHGYARAYPTNTDADPNATFRLTPIRERGVGSSGPPILILAVAVALVLLTACANVANLLLVRATARSHEAAVRLAIGATRWDLARWLCAESLLLALAGGALGVLAALWGIDLASAFLAGLPRGSEIAVNGRVLLFSFAVSSVAGILFGLAPLTRLARQSPVSVLRASRSSAAGRRGAAAVLVVGEVAVSLVLLVSAGLLLQSVTRMLAKPVGFQPERVMTVRLSLPAPQYGDAGALRSFMTRLTERLDATPGIASAAASMVVPPNPTVMAPYQTGDGVQRPIGERPAGVWTAVTPRYFTTLGIPIVEGRGLSETDRESTPLVVVISQTLAKRAWPNQSPIGKRLLVGRASGFAEVVGVAGDVKNAGLGFEPLPEMYTPYVQRPWPSFALVVRSAGPEPLTLVNAVRSAVAAIDPGQPVTEPQSMETALADSIATARAVAWLLAVFAAVALVMAAAGLYGVIAYAVERRTREIGVRMALGAAPGAVLRLVAIDGLRLAAFGLAAGTAGAAIAARAIRSQLFGVSAADPVTYAAVMALFAVVAAAACIIPARRALSVDPLVALRAD